ncbi:DNA repair ATPase [Streptomyces gamaensis]|uniref:DNA repair ATPase n=1 Tax=Streptomyces gamaensis TaxID=1763542 RepID=A0ABW0Z0X6_9ACTN
MTTEDHPANTPLEAGTYEVLRDRLRTAARELDTRARELNERRVETFGGGGLALTGSASIPTGRPAVARDLAHVGGHLLVGYQPAAGGDAPAEPGDVFALYANANASADGQFTPAPTNAIPGLLDNPHFQHDFHDLHRYYRSARLLQLHHAGPLLLAVFQTGDRLTDIRVLRWRIAPDGTPSYLDAKGERDHVFPPSHDFTWTPTTRDDHRPGRHPHIAVDDTVYVSTAGGTLTVKTADDTETADGVHHEPVAEPLQSLADADVEFARVGPLLLLRVRPYKENDWRHLVVNTRTDEVVRLDGIGQACRRLPEDQGVIFPGGVYLATGGARTFDVDTEGLEYERLVRSPNGEDVLYVFHARATGRTLLLPYNVIREEAANPIVTHGCALFDDGTLAVLRTDPGSEPARLHPLQTWATPYTSEAYAAARPTGDGPLARVGNAELVRGVSECLTVARMADDMTPTAAVFEAIEAAAIRVGDTFPWLDDPSLGGLAEPLDAVRATAAQVTEEFRRVTELRGRAADALGEAAVRTTTLVRRIRGEQPATADGWVKQLTELRHTQGHLETLREIRYLDLDQLAGLTTALADDLAATGRRAVAFLRGEDAFAATHRAVADLAAEAADCPTVAATEPLAERLAEHAEGLRTVTDVVSSLDLADATDRTSILGRVAEVLGAVNRARATLDARRRSLLESEGRAEFTAEFALLGQAVDGALAAAGTPQECDEHLGRLLVQVENLEARFGAFDDYLERVAARREEIYEAFSARKQAQLDERARRAQRLADSAQRVLVTVARRARSLPDADAVGAYFASDPLVAKVRTTARELRDLGEAVRADELDGRLKAARQEAARALRDRGDLYDDAGTIRLGRHRFAVTTQSTDLTLVPHDGELVYAITGTDYRAPVRDAALTAHRAFWDQPLVSESPEVYRAEHLAALWLDRAGPDALAERDPAALRDAVRRLAATRYDEGYDRGVHDHDAAALLTALLPVHAAAGLLRHTPDVRAAAQLFWAHGTDEHRRTPWTVRAQSLARARRAFGTVPAVADLAAELADAAGDFLGQALPGLDADRESVGAYLFEELAAGTPRFVTSAAARTLLDGFRASLGGDGSPAAKEFAEDLRALEGDLPARYQLVTAWLGSYLHTLDAADTPELPEATAVELCGTALERRHLDTPLTATATGLLGAHPRVATGGSLPLRLDEFLARTGTFRRTRVPAHRAYTRARTEALAAERARLRLDELTPRTMSAFVRNRLIDEVYLPLIGDNLAKQLGAAGDGRRTDSQGLLLLLSPPGYGKTTLLEYVAARLGLVFVKVDGPALGHRTTSLDPAAAPDAAARREVEKINFALEMGNNTFLYLDDIQHTSPELLQKFISLCDAQRRMEGVRDGQARTYDLRGKRFAVCMAGNPYTESGARFRIPDMLANRADVWNLGDTLSGKEDLFALSHIENALTSHPVLAPLAARDRADLDLLLRLARGDDSVHPDRLAHPYAPAELDQITAVLARLQRVTGTVLAVNAAYIASAAQSENTRTEPPFRLQGSYRNTNKLAERILPVMNDSELEALIDDHYLAEAQTLTGDAESNLLKLAELRGRLSEEQARRWAEIKEAYVRGQRAGRG